MMASSSLLILFCVALLVRQGIAEVWEFGVDAPGSVVVEQKEGQISIFEKTHEINLDVPECYVIEYVRVEVQNSVSNPSVQYNRQQRIVRITYKALQFSASSYTVLAKAERKPGCYNLDTVALPETHTFAKY